MEQNAFNSSILPQNFTIPKGVTNIGEKAFFLVKLPQGCVWLDKNGVKISTPIAGAKVDIRPRENLY